MELLLTPSKLEALIREELSRSDKTEIRGIVSAELDKKLKTQVKKILEDELSKALNSKASKEEHGASTNLAAILVAAWIKFIIDSWV